MNKLFATIDPEPDSDKFMCPECSFVFPPQVRCPNCELTFEINGVKN